MIIKIIKSELNVMLLKKSNKDIYIYDLKAITVNNNKLK